jgi:type VI secretion system protein VasD
MFNITLLIALFTLLLGGCGSDPEKPESSAPPEPPKTLIEAQITVSCQVNPDIDGRPSPIVMRIYELKTLGKFEDADFYKLFNDYASVLGEDLIASEKFHLRPGDAKTIKNSVSPETKFIAITAAYRDLNQSVWRGSIPIEAAKNNEFMVRLDQLNVNITIPESPPNLNSAPAN